MEFNPYVNFSQYYIEDIKKQSEIINSDLQFIEINTNINCEITNNWIKCKESMTKKEYQFVFDFWAQNAEFEPKTMEITEELRNTIIQEKENKEKFARLRDSQYQFIKKIVTEYTKLNDNSNTIKSSPKLKSGVLVFNLIIQNRFVTDEIKKKVSELEKIIEEDRKDISDWVAYQSIDLKEYLTARRKTIEIDFPENEDEYNDEKIKLWYEEKLKLEYEQK